MRTSVVLLSLAILGCQTPPPNAKPWPCVRFREDPQVYQELLEMKHTHEAILWNGREATYANPGDKGLYLATRRWVAKADEKCAADRALVGEPVDQRETLPWWRRFWIWLPL